MISLVVLHIVQHNRAVDAGEVVPQPAAVHEVQVAVLGNVMPDKGEVVLLTGGNLVAGEVLPIFLFSSISSSTLDWLSCQILSRSVSN